MPFDSVSGSIAGSVGVNEVNRLPQESFRDGLKHIAQDIIDSMDISSLTNSQKIQYFLKVVLPYIIDKNKKADNSEKQFRRDNLSLSLSASAKNPLLT